MVDLPLTNTPEEIDIICKQMLLCPKSGMHNPLKNPERYRGWGDILGRVAELMHDKEINQHFVNLLQTVIPRTTAQAEGEIRVTTRFLENFSGDNPRFALRSFGVAGDSEGQFSNGMRFPYGPVGLIVPFNFPLEIPVLQMIGALIAGNKVLVKGDRRVSIVIEHFIRLLDYCGAYSDSLVYIHTDGPNMHEILTILKKHLRILHFTGSSKIAHQLGILLDGKIRCEDSGFNWKLLGPDVSDLEYIASQCDQDAYAASGQKCSA